VGFYTKSLKIYIKSYQNYQKIKKVQKVGCFTFQINSVVNLFYISK